MPTLIQPGLMIPPLRATKQQVKYYQTHTPMSIIVDWIKERMVTFGGRKAKSPADRLLVVRAKTGSGKSTAMPVAIFNIIKPRNVTEYRGRGVLCTQPRVLTAQEIAKDIASDGWAPDMILGKTIGFSTGSGKVLGTAGAKSMLVYATIDTLLAQLKQDNAKDIIENLYQFIILDEVHERSLTFDMTVMLLKKYIYENYDNPKCPFVILTSATFDADKYCKYLNIDSRTNLMDVKGSVFPITERYLNTNSTNTIITALEIIKDIVEEKINPMEQGKNDILVFAFGMAPMKELKQHLLKYNIERIQKKKKPFVVSIVEGYAVNYNTIERQIVYMKYDDLSINDNGEYDPKGKYTATQRIIMGTNVAETGLTIPTLGHCVDLGWKKVNEMYSPYGIKGVIQKPVDRNNVMQRRGRVGRKFPGHFYATYTEQTFNSLTSMQLPSIMVEDISNEVIDILIQQNNCFDINKIDMLDTPPIDSLKSAIEKNIVLGYIKSDYGKCFIMSELGELARQVRYVSVEILRCLISGYVYDVCILDLVTMVSMTSVRMRKVDVPGILKEILPSFFFAEEDFMSIYTAITMDDFVTGLFVFEAFAKSSERGIEAMEAFCEKYKLDLNSMIGVIGSRLSIMDDLSTIMFDPLYMQDESIIHATRDNYIKKISLLKQCIYDGFKLNIIYNDKKSRGYKNRFGLNVRCNLPNREVGFPKYIVTNNIQIASNAFSPTFQHTLEVDRVCVLDGYVSIDNDLLTPVSELTYQNKSTNRININSDPKERLKNYNMLLKDTSDLKMLFTKTTKLVNFLTINQ